MGTREDCKRGYHTVDNQGVCWFCGKLLEPDWWYYYAGKPHPDDKTQREDGHADQKAT